MNKLLGMMCFVRVIESQTFAGAAAALGLSASAVTKNVKKLEADLGSQLLLRTTRRVGMTTFGREYFESCRKILDELESVESSLHAAQSGVRGTLRLQCPTFFARVTLFPRLAEFRKRYPDLQLEIVTGGDLTSLSEGKVDLAVVIGDVRRSGFAARTLARSDRICCASPAYLRAHGCPETIEDLQSHACLVGGSAPWRFKVGGRVIRPRLAGDLKIHGGDALRDAVLTGHGIAQLNHWLFRDDLLRGAAVEVLKAHRVTGDPVSAVYVPTRYLPTRVRVMIDFLGEITREVMERPD